MRKYIKSMSIYIILGISGCATVSNSDTEQISVTTRDRSGTVVEGAACDWMNTRGSGSFVTPAVILVSRDYAAIHFRCKKEGFQDIVDAFDSQASSAMGRGNLLAGGFIGLAVDHITGNGYQYSPSITLWFSTLASTPVAKTSPPPREAERVNLKNFSAIPGVSEYCRERYQVWLGWPTPKAFALGTDSNCGFTTGTSPPNPDLAIPDPSERAVAACNRRGKGDCKLYAVDADVVWKPQ